MRRWPCGLLGNGFSSIRLILLSAFSIAPLLAEERPNVILIFTDDWGYADLGCQGIRQDVKTPHLDRLAKEGVRFTDGYVTAPQCSPSRAALLTGKYQQRFGFDSISEGPLPLGEKTLADRLRGAGYATGFVGKWHLDPNEACLRWARREHPKSVQGGLVRVTPEITRRFSPGARGFGDFYWGELDTYRRNFDLSGRTLRAEGEIHHTQDDRIEEQTRAALAFLRRQDQKPFFLYLAYYAPHVPLAATKSYLDRFPGEMPERRRTALAMMAAVDDGVGRMMDWLEEKGLRTNTLIAFSSDNGAPLGAHEGEAMADVLPVGKPGPAWDGSMNTPLNGEKGMLAEGGIRVPFLLSWPTRVPQGKVVTQPVMTLDLTATIHAAAGLPPEPSFDGIDLLPYLAGPGKPLPSRELYWRFWNQSALRSGEWKLLQAGSAPPWLFNLEKDPGEKGNDFKRNRETGEGLRKRLSSWTTNLQPPGIPAGPLNPQETAWYRFYFGAAETSAP